ncbi:MAG: lamin tail domain-containing protein [Bacteroidota bacterium]
MKLLPFILLLLPVSLFAQNRYDVVIDEIMSDPTPQVGLPNNEWVELKNTSVTAINLQGWRIGDVSGQSGPMPAFTLQPDSFVIVCTGSAVAALSVYGATISVTSFPSLDNDGEQLFLKNGNGMTIHAIDYSSSWFKNELKKEGGWSLEMIDTKNPCTGSDNWKASIDASGGTPGRKNSVDAVVIDHTAPQLKNSYTTDKQTIVLTFDESLDSVSASTITDYSIDGGITINSAITLPPLFNLVQLKLTTDLSGNNIYTITTNNVTDCKGNSIGSASTVKTGIPVDAAAGDLVINEILFNPRPNGFDYIEVYNKSNKIFDASKISIANRNSSGVISSIKTLSATPVYIFPGDYVLLTENLESLQLNYLVKNPDKVFVISPMPSYPDDEGDVVLLNLQGEVADEVKYNKDWHFKLIDNDEGVSLERIDPDGPSQDAGNWHSAASTAGFGTPTYVNSQFKQVQDVTATIELNSKVFSPDNDGRSDFAIIQYKISEPGHVANVTVFDAAGKPVRSLVKNETIAASGHWNWDGLNDQGRKLPVGSYIIYTEIFNLQGKKKMFKNVIVLARRLN